MFVFAHLIISYARISRVRILRAFGKIVMAPVPEYYILYQSFISARERTRA